ncbi:MAG: hypothetical protein HOI95_01215 [Chromatiales bacterium]|nr:hypothetical protein [Chromatiales bacterium]
MKSMAVVRVERGSAKLACEPEAINLGPQLVQAGTVTASTPFDIAPALGWSGAVDQWRAALMQYAG